MTGSAAEIDPRSISLWHDTLPVGDLDPRPPLDGSTEADVAIVGGGYTGLWAAYYLLRHEPDLSVAVIEAEVCGFGASGRNGGWASHELAIDREGAARVHGREAVVSLLREVCASIDEIGTVAAEESIDCHYAKGGSLTFATGSGQLPRVRAMVEHERAWGFGRDDFRWLDPSQAEAHARVAGSLGAMYTPHCAAIHPARLVRGLARAVERRGGRIYEGTRALGIEPGGVDTASGRVRASNVLRCTEAFTAALPGRSREYVPVFSLMIATEPLTSDVWDDIGLGGRPTFTDGRHLVIYGQRTADGRLAFGGRGAPYHFGSAIRPEFDRDEATHASIDCVLRGLFPQIGDARITHRWGGAVAIPRDWQASVRLDPVTGLGQAGGYVGAGVTASNLAGRTLADLVLGRDTDLVHLPWVGHVSRLWEPEPLRWVGINLGRMLAPAADAVEARTGRSSRILGGALRLLTGH